MIRVDVVQGTKEWLDAKLGIPSASNFDRILTPKTMKVSSAMAGYCHELLAEKVLGHPLDDATSQFMQRGTLEEKAARAWYGLQQDVDVEEVGFLLRDDGRVGCSPDGLVGNDGGLEIKTPNAQTHVGYMLGEVKDKYTCQIQGGMWITEREWWDFVSYRSSACSKASEFPTSGSRSTQNRESHHENPQSPRRKRQRHQGRPNHAGRKPRSDHRSERIRQDERLGFHLLGARRHVEHSSEAGPDRRASCDR